MGVTIKDLARETGLTAATISAYFNGGNVRAYNREKIERAIEKLGYVRNDYARALRTHKSMTVGVLIPEMSNLFSTTIIAEMEEDHDNCGDGRRSQAQGLRSHRLRLQVGSQKRAGGDEIFAFKDGGRNDSHTGDHGE